MVIFQRSLIVGLVFSVLSFASLEATSLIERSVSDLSRDAKEIYRVKILATEYKRTSRQVWTEYKAEVLEAFKGDTPSSSIVTLHLPGGKDGERGFKVLGLPDVRVGGEYIVFLDNRLRTKGVHRLTSWQAYIVGRDQSGDRYVMSAGSQKSSKSEHRALHAAERSQIRSYDNFVEDVFVHMD